jgi:hypothetical protein
LVFKGVPYLRSRCRPAGTFSQDIAFYKITQGAPRLPPSLPPVQNPVAISDNSGNDHDFASGDSDRDDSGWWGEAACAAAKYDDPIQPSNKGKSISHVNKGQTNDISILLVPRCAADGFRGAIISLGPQTDAVLDCFMLDDTWVPRLRVLTHQVRSSKWEANLRNLGLSYEQAANLLKAMLVDAHAPQPGMHFSLQLTDINWALH